jgi:hypothetical protein
MATPADQRLLDLLDKWLKSLELHLQYASLDDESYAKIQAWPEHQRPSRWIVDLAKQKALALQTQLQERIKTGDVTFSDSLELMSFLANLVGADHIERFIPLAHGESDRVAAPATGAAPKNAAPADHAAATGTREMPKFAAGHKRAPQPPATPAVARTERKTPKPAGEAKAAPAKKSGQDVPPKSTTGSKSMNEQVIADAARLVQWGRKWYELAELISSMADRPSLIEVRRILQDNKTVIDRKAGRN